MNDKKSRNREYRDRDYRDRDYRDRGYRDRDYRAGKGKDHKAGRVIWRIFAMFLTTLVALFIAAYGTLWIFCHGPSVAGRDLFVSTILETGALKFLAGWYFDKEEILEITSNNSMGVTADDVNVSLIEIPTQDPEQGEGDTEENTNPYDDHFDENGIEIITVTGRSYMGKVMIVKDPSKVRVGTIYPWATSKSQTGMPLGDLVEHAGAIAGVNGGMYESAGNWGGKPMGIVVCGGEIQFNQPTAGDVLVGMNTDNILVIKDIGGMSADNVKKLIEEDNIRDAVSFKDIDDGDSNHFTKLIINGEARAISGNGSGANPRTVVGQRKDGAILLFVTDGRGHEGHIGATAADLISVMQEYGAVNAANLDGGSSSSMFYDGVYEMTSVTLYSSTSSWNLPTGIVVDK